MVIWECRQFLPVSNHTQCVKRASGVGTVCWEAKKMNTAHPLLTICNNQKNGVAAAVPH
jgi:hypothetical protein